MVAKQTRKHTLHVPILLTSAPKTCNTTEISSGFRTALPEARRISREQRHVYVQLLEELSGAER
jgi:hypothetical protein